MINTQLLTINTKNNKILGELLIFDKYKKVVEMFELRTNALPKYRNTAQLEDMLNGYPDEKNHTIQTQEPIKSWINTKIDEVIISHIYLHIIELTTHTRKNITNIIQQTLSVNLENCIVSWYTECELTDQLKMSDDPTELLIENPLAMLLFSNLYGINLPTTFKQILTKIQQENRKHVSILLHKHLVKMRQSELFKLKKAIRRQRRHQFIDQAIKDTANETLNHNSEYTPNTDPQIYNWHLPKGHFIYKKNSNRSGNTMRKTMM